MLLRVLCLLLTLFATLSYADRIAIIGTGDVAAALGPEFAAQGHTIVYGSRDPSREEVLELVAKSGDDASVTSPRNAAEHADIVVLAVPGMMVEDITLGLGNLAGKIIIDPTNPLNRGDGGFTHAVDSSNAEIIQAAAPGAHVVKAFNALSWTTMIDPDSAGGPVSIPLAGNNVQAKQTVAALVEGMGLEAIDVGPVENAHWIEGMLILWIDNRYGSERESFDFHLRKN